MARASMFNIAFYLWTVAMVILFIPGLALPHRVIVFGQRQWARGVNWLMARLVGIEVEIRGRENLPAGGSIVAAKHQSAWDTLIWHAILEDPAVVLKKELLYIPVYGLMCLKSRMIIIDRKGKTKAVKALIRQARRAIGEGRPVVVFPQGTRTAPGTAIADVPYQPGVSALYRSLDAPAVPVALNSGMYWPRRSLRRWSGTIVLEFLAPIAPGLPRREFENLLAERIEGATARLEQEALADRKAI